MTDRITPEQLAELAELHELTTSGEWAKSPSWALRHEIVVRRSPIRRVARDISCVDTDSIVALHNVFPALKATIEGLWRENEWLRRERDLAHKALADLEDGHNG